MLRVSLADLFHPRFFTTLFAKALGFFDKKVSRRRFATFATVLIEARFENLYTSSRAFF